jgi:hypothetical protein
MLILPSVDSKAWHGAYYPIGIVAMGIEIYGDVRFYELEYKFLLRDIPEITAHLK